MEPDGKRLKIGAVQQQQHVVGVMQQLHAMPVRKARRVVNTSEVLHKPMVDIWNELEQTHNRKTRRMLNRFERILEKENSRNGCRGDETVAKVKDIFYNGLGIVWGGEYAKAIF